MSQVRKKQKYLRKEKEEKSVVTLWLANVTQVLPHKCIHHLMSKLEKKDHTCFNGSCIEVKHV